MIAKIKDLKNNDFIRNHGLVAAFSCAALSIAFLNPIYGAITTGVLCFAFSKAKEKDLLGVLNYEEALQRHQKKYKQLSDEHPLTKRVHHLKNKAGIDRDCEVFLDENFDSLGHACDIVRNPFIITVNEIYERPEINGFKDVQDYIIAHELGHIANKSVAKKAMNSLLLLASTALSLAISSKIIPEGSALIFPMVLSLAACAPASKFHERQDEHDTDEFAVNLTGKPEIAVKFHRISKEALAGLHKNNLLQRLFSSHPSQENRAKRIETRHRLSLNA
jgi:hypothetical protein